MKKLHLILTILNLVVIASFWYRFSAPVVNTSSGYFSKPEAEIESIGIFLAAQANHFSMLQIFLILFSIGLSIAAIWGYNELKKIVEQKTAERVNNVLPLMVTRTLEKFTIKELNRLSFDGKVIKRKKKKSFQANFKNDIESD